MPLESDGNGQRFCKNCKEDHPDNRTVEDPLERLDEYVKVLNQIKRDISELPSHPLADGIQQQIGRAVVDLKKWIKEPDMETYEQKLRKRGGFVPPTVEEVRSYCTERSNGIDPEAFVAHYASKGWVVGRSKMKDWKSAMITWEKNKGNFTNGKPTTSPRVGPGQRYAGPG